MITFFMHLDPLMFKLQKVDWFILLIYINISDCCSVEKGKISRFTRIWKFQTTSSSTSWWCTRDLTGKLYTSYYFIIACSLILLKVVMSLMNIHTKQFNQTCIVGTPTLRETSPPHFNCCQSSSHWSLPI